MKSKLLMDLVFDLAFIKEGNAYYKITTEDEIHMFPVNILEQRNLTLWHQETTNRFVSQIERAIDNGTLSTLPNPLKNLKP